MEMEEVESITLLNEEAAGGTIPIVRSPVNKDSYKEPFTRGSSKYDKNIYSEDNTNNICNDAENDALHNLKVPEINSHEKLSFSGPNCYNVNNPPKTSSDSSKKYILNNNESVNLIPNGSVNLIANGSIQSKSNGSVNLIANGSFQNKSNGCLVEGTLEEPSNGKSLLPFSEMKIRMSKLPRRMPVDLEFTELSYCVSNGKKKGYKSILKGVSGKFSSGNLTAIMGPSGAGKSTLMNILAGYRTSDVSGEILVNGKQRTLKSFRKQSCYIMQEDHLLPFLTIQESMDGAATLKLGDKVAKSDKNRVVTEILETLNLQDCRSTRVSNLSGGEKKRLSIALELVNNPPVMFFDEPTSGLDSQNSYQCIHLLKSLAEEGRTIICTIHQPSARLFEQFDLLYALAEGQCIYRGSIFDLVPFMASLALECPSYHNPADFLVEVASGEYGSFVHKLVGAVNCGYGIDQSIETPQTNGAITNLDLVSNKEGVTFGGVDEVDSFKKPDLGTIYFPDNETKIDVASCHQSFLPCEESIEDYPASFCVQFSVLFRRTFLSIIRDMMLTKLRLLAHIVVGLFIGLLYYKAGNEASKVLSNVGCIFFCTLFLLFTSMMPTILTFPLEMKVFIREHLNHWYSLKAYYLAKTMADMPFQFVFPFVFVIIIYFMTDQLFETNRFLLFTTLCIMTALVAQSIGLAIGAAMDIQQAVFFGPAAAIPALLFSGFFVSFTTIPFYLQWLTYLSYIRYGYEGLLISIYGLDRGQLDCSEAFCMFKHPTKILEQMDVEESFLWFDVVLLFIYFLLMRGLGYFILRWKLRKDR